MGTVRRKALPEAPGSLRAGFASRHDLRKEDTIDITGAAVDGMRGKRLRYREFITDNGLFSGARGA